MPGAPAATGDLDLAGLWQNVLEAVGRASPFARSYLVEAYPVSLAKGVLTIAYDPQFADQLGLVNNQKTHSLLQTKLQELGHDNVQIRFILAEAKNPPAVPASASEAALTASPPAPAIQPKAVAAPTPVAPPIKPQRPVNTNPSTDDFKNDPLIQKALEVFKGQIVEVRV